jgi:hypothetical protein
MKNFIMKNVLLKKPIEIEMLSDDRREEYQDFILSNPKAVIYATTEFREFLRFAVGGKGHCIIAREDGMMVGALPYFSIENGKFGTVVNSLPWFGSHGGCILKDPGYDDVREALLGRYSEITRSLEAISVTTILTHIENEKIRDYTRLLNRILPISASGR